MSFCSVSLCCVTLLLGLTGTPGLANPAPHGASGAAEQLFQENKFNQARTAYTQAIRRSPSDVSLRMGLIRTLLRLDAWAEAVAQGQTAVTQAPQNPGAHGLYALALMRGGRPDKAAAQAKRALALKADDYWGLVASGRVLIWDDKDKEAREALRHATQIHPEWPEAWYYLLDTFDHETRAEALKALQTYRHLAPKGHPHDGLMEALKGDMTSYEQAFEKEKAFRPGGDITETQWKAADEGNAPPVSVVVPIQRDEDDILLPLKINGTKFRLEFDTGAGTRIALGRSAAQRLNLPSLAASYVHGVNGKEVTKMHKADSLEIGALAFRSIPLHSIDNEIGDAEKQDGLFGGAVLKSFVVTIDFERNTMTLCYGKNAAAPPAAPGTHRMKVPFHLREGYIFVPIKMEDSEDTEWAMLDTGASWQGVLSLKTAREIAKKRPESSSEEVQIEQRLGVGVSQKGFTALLFDFGVELTMVSAGGPKFFMGMDKVMGANFMDEGISREFDFQLAAIVGIKYLTSAKRVTFDYPHHLLTLELPDIGN